MPKKHTCPKHGPQNITAYYLTGGRRRCKLCEIAKAKRYAETHPNQVRARYKRWHEQRRLTVLRHYSGEQEPTCACCGEAHLQFLTIDHEQGGGTQHRKQVGKDMVSWIIRNNFPPMFRILCHNCNASFGAFGGCPHELENKKG